MDNESKHSTVLRIKNMVCPRCILVVREELEKLSLQVLQVELGSATIDTSNSIDHTALEASLVSKGFELILDKQDELVESCKTAIIELIYSGKVATLNTNISTYLGKELGKDYSTISTAFKASEGIALNRYVILHKIERAKELISYNELTISEIATRLGYKSVQHLSSQFKEVTGLTPNQYKKEPTVKRNMIDNIE